MYLQIAGEIATASDDAGDAIAGGGVFRDIIGEEGSVGAVADNDGAEDAAVGFLQRETIDGADKGAEEEEKNETEDGGIDGDGADWEEVFLFKVADGNNRHGAKDGSEEETKKFGGARGAEEDFLLVEFKRGEENKPKRNQKDEGGQEVDGAFLEKVGASIEVHA